MDFSSFVFCQSDQSYIHPVCAFSNLLKSWICARVKMQAGRPPLEKSASMIAKQGPYRTAESAQGGVEAQPLPSAIRYYHCDNYSTCLNVAAALNWSGFSCCGCCGTVNEALLWQARQAQKKDAIAKRICSLPHAELHESQREPEKVVSILGKR
jgi:predicted Fe-S protein YdhL (DUF1289 family)